MENAVGPGVATSLEVARLMSALKNQEASTDLLNAQVEKTGAETMQSTANTRNIEEQTKNLTKSFFEIQARIDDLKASANLKDQQNQLTLVEMDLKRTMRAYYQGQIGYNEALKRKAMAETSITELGQPKAESEAGFWRSSYGRAAPYINQGISNARGVSGIFKPFAQ